MLYGPDELDRHVFQGGNPFASGIGRLPVSSPAGTAPPLGYDPTLGAPSSVYSGMASFPYSELVVHLAGAGCKRSRPIHPSEAKHEQHPHSNTILRSWDAEMLQCLHRRENATG